MFSNRTRLLLLIAIVLTVAMGWIAHSRHQRCAETRQSFSRRAPIAGASGTDTFVCAAMVESMPIRDKLLSLAWFVCVLAAVRSILIDRHDHRMPTPSRWNP